MTERILSHFCFLRFTPDYWNLPSNEQKNWHQQILVALSESDLAQTLYQVFPAAADVDVLVWSSMLIGDNAEIDVYFDKTARFFNRFRSVLEPVSVYWGFTRPSDYARGKSSQEIEPFDGQREPYLVVYPFVKTAAWYQLGRDTRQGMMNEHIRIGHQYKEIKQLLLYSSGLQDQEFVVIYEMGDLPQFSALVTELRGSEARRYTERDTPLYTAIYRDPQEILALFEAA
ncbi:MAG: chlorite dismutase [Anaerolineaceae bacterium]|nr:chlorite dismutase [Anaerolineaceae bacterium]